MEEEVKRGVLSPKVKAARRKARLIKHLNDPEFIARDSNRIK